MLTCQKSGGDKITLDFWAMGVEGENIQSLLPAFLEQNPDLAVRVQAIPWSAAHDLLLTAFAGGSSPDVCQLGNTWIPEFQAIGAIQPLDDFLASGGVREQDYFAGIWQTNVIKERLYGIPWYVDTRLLFCRRDLFKEAGFAGPPATWDEWLALSRRLSHPQKSRYAIFLSTIFNDWQVPVILILENNGRLLRDNDCYGAFDEPATLDALRFYVNFFEEKLAVFQVGEVANIFQGFSEGVFSMMITGPWNVNEIRKRLPQFADRWTTAPMPAKANGASLAGGSSLVIFNGSRHSQEAWRLIEYLSQSATQKAFFRQTQDLPAVKPAWEAAEIRNDVEIMAFYRQLERVLPTPKIAEWEQVAVKLQEYLELVIYKRMTLEAAVTSLNRDVDRILEKRRWMVQRGLL